MESAQSRFDFGKNWQSFVRTAVNEQRIAGAVAALRRLLNAESLSGKSFLDIGCGSGLSSLAAISLGAERVVGFDSDPHSVEASLALREQAGVPPEKWQIMQGSVLDEKFLATLDAAEIAYSWGVLHHTGAMWRAIDNAVKLVDPGGVLAISIYNNVERRVGGSAMWWHIKRTYNRAPRIGRRMMEGAYVTYVVTRLLIALRNPVRYVRHYSEEQGRGMDFWHDVRDWLGGFPYEYATAGEVFNYVHRKFGLQLEYLNTTNVHACNEFVFRGSS